MPISPVRTAARGSGSIGNYNIVVPAATVSSWKHRANLKVPCQVCDGTGKIGTKNCLGCSGTGKIIPYISLPANWKQTRIIKISFTFEQLAWALGGLPPGQAALILCKYVHGETDKNVLKGTDSVGFKKDKRMLIKAFVEKVVTMAYRENWKTDKFKKGTLVMSCLCAIDEVLDPGYGSWTESKRSRGIGVSRVSYYRDGWRYRYSKYLNLLTNWESYALTSMYWRLNQ